ncbi:MAG: hypothetical protein HYY35_04335 [Deltaproteobacteria bacterium]|nr:hypothetical protein [Deltaproteobacteria bacterium]
MAGASLDSLRALTATALDETTAPAALAATLEALRLRHGALLRYHSDSQSLSLLAHEGLAQPAIDAIRLVRRGVSGAWDMPLHAVLQRRVYIIDRPKDNPFVPTLLQGTDQGVLTNAAVVPLFAAGLVTGALLLVGSGKRAIHEADVLALRDLGKLLGAAVRPSSRVPAPARPVGGQPTSAPREDAVRDRAMLTARISELESLVESLRRTAGAGASAAEVERRLAEVSRERDRYKSEAALHEISLRNLRSEFDLARDQSASEAERSRRLAVEMARMREELAAAVDSGKRSLAELERRDRARAELEQRLAAVERQLGETAGHVQTGEADREDLISRVSLAEQEVEALRKSLRAREEQIADLRGERERLTASLQKAATRYQTAEDSIAQLRESTEITLGELRDRIESLQERAADAERERDQLTAGSAGRAEVLREIERETERYRAELARESERRRVAEQTASSVIHDAAALRAETERVQDERQMAHAEAERSRADAQRLAAELEALRQASAAEIERLRHHGTELEQRFAETESARKTLAAELERLRPDLAARVKSEAELRAREAARNENDRQVGAELNDLRRRLDQAVESSRALTRERDALLARVATLQETTGNLLRDGEKLLGERERHAAELATLRAAADAEAAEIGRLRAEAEGAQAATERLRGELSVSVDRRTEAADLAQALEREVAALRAELESVQSRGSELTADFARREQELQAALAGARGEAEAAERARHDHEAERKELQARVREMERSLQGASAHLAEKAREGDLAEALRATLAKSESARRSAEEAVTRLEAALASERQTAARLRTESEAERESTREIVRRLEEVERKLAESEATTSEAIQQTASLAAEKAAAQEAAQSVAAELGRRSAAVNELSTRLESMQRSLAEREAAIEEAARRTQQLEEAARSSARDIETLRRQSTATQDEKDRRIHELELRVAEASTRGERLVADLQSMEDDRASLRAAIGALESERRQVGEGAREVAAKTAALEAAARRHQADNERLTSEIESARQRIADLDSTLRSLETESGRWRALAETLQGNLEERDREIRGLRAAPRPSAAAAEKPGAPPSAAKPSPTKAVGVSAAKPPPAPRAPGAAGSRTVIVLDDPGQALNALTQTCGGAAFEARALDNGAALNEPPAYTAVNLLASRGGLEGLLRSRTEEPLAASRLMLYANKPGSGKGVVLANVECLIRPIEEKDFAQALSLLLGHGKRVTIIGEELDSVLKLNGWATARGCSVSSAGDLKQGNEILDIVKPDLIVFDFSRLGAEGAGLVVKARRSSRLEALPVLLVLPPGAHSPSASFFLKRLTALAEETPLDFAPMVRRLIPPDKPRSGQN